MLLPYGEYFNDYVNMDLGVFEGVEFNEMVNKGRRVCRFCAGGVGLWKSDMPGSLAIGGTPQVHPSSQSVKKPLR